MSAPTGHVHVSEREVAHTWPNGQYDDAAWEDCTAMTALELARLAWNPAIPATHYEGERLRQAAGVGPSGGMDYYAVRKGYAARYGWQSPNVGQGFANLWAALTPGKAGIVAGAMSAFPAGHRLRRWDTGFTGRHSLFVSRYSTLDEAWWCDPLAPSGTYTGERVTKAELGAFMNAGGGTYIVAPLKGGEMSYVLTLEKLGPENPRPFTVPAGVTLNGYDPAQPGKVVASVTGPSTGHADATASVSWPGQTNPPVPRGGGFLHVVDLLPGLYVVAAFVTLAPAAVPTPPSGTILGPGTYIVQ